MNLQKIEDLFNGVGCVNSVKNITIENNRLISIAFDNFENNIMTIKVLKEEELLNLYDFYFNGLNNESRILWSPFPLFKPPLNSKEELISRYYNWLKEDDWCFWILTGDYIIGACLLKKLSWNDEPNSEHRSPTSGLAISEDYKRMGYGFLLQRVIECQASLLGKKKIYATVDENNIASLKVHEKSGFIRTGKIFPRYINQDKKIPVTNIIEFVYNIDNDNL